MTELSPEAAGTEQASLPEEHPLRRPLSAEVHARPFVHLSAPEQATHLAMLSGEGSQAADHAHLESLCARHGVQAPPRDANHALLDFGAYRLKWERHTEFCSYTFFRSELAGDDPFEHPVLDRVPAEWRDAIPGKLLTAVNIVLEPPDVPEREPDSVAQLMGSQAFAAAAVSGGAAIAYMDFSIDARGFGRIFVSDRGMKPRQAGRLVQRLFEVETYRMLALLALPLAREHGRDLTRLGDQLSGITQRLPEIQALEEERELLSEITTLSAQAERIAAATQYRFSASNAYYALVQRRIEELRETRVEGYQTFTEFVDRRLAPAMRTCQAVSDRLDSLSRRLTRAGNLLRTRVDIQLEGQNRDLLQSMDRRAHLQLRLQETVEGLSVAAITYYAVSLVGYAAKGVEASGVPLPVELLTAISIPLVAGGVWYAIRRVRRFIERQTA